MQHTQRNLHRTIKTLVTLRQIEDNVRKENRFNAETQFPNFCKTLQELYNAERSAIGKNVCSFIRKNRYLEEYSFLEVSDKLEKETQHSQFLKYVWDGRHGAKNLLHFLKTIPEIVNEPWLDTIKAGSYEIKDECCTWGLRKKNLNGKRIDLLIKDKDHKWLICIENKVYSRLHNAGTSNRSQLEAYKEYCDKGEEFREYDTKVYIVLSLNEENRSDTEEGWFFITYHQLFGALLQRDRNKPNAIVEDYLKALYRLLYGWNMSEIENGSLSQYILFDKTVLSKI